MNLRFKNSFIIGILFLLPIIFTLFMIRTISGVFDVWNPLFRFLSLPDSLHGLFAILLSIIFIWIIGLFLTSPFFDRYVGSRIPVFRKIWGTLKIISERMLFVSKGGYQRVVYEAFGKGSELWRPAFVVGKTSYRMPDGAKRKMLVIAQNPPNIFDPLLIPPKDTLIVDNGIQDVLLYIASGGFMSPPELSLREWTEKSLDEIPEFRGNRPPAP